MGLLINRAMALCNASGTGAVTPGAGKAPYRTWAAAGAQAGYWYDYLIEQGSDWEIGVGLYNGTTISRPGPGVDPWFESSTGSLLSVTASATIACVANQGTLQAPAKFMPPIPSSFTLVSGDATNLALTVDKSLGMLVDCGLPSSTNAHRLAYQTLSTPSGDFDLIANLNATFAQSSFLFWGIFMRDSVSGRLHCNYWRKTGQIDLCTLPGLTGFSGDNLFSVSDTSTWHRITVSGANVTFLHSMDGGSWTAMYSTTVTSYLTNRPNQVGIGAFYNVGNSEFNRVRLSCPYYSLTGSAV